MIAARPATLAAARLVVEAQTPLPETEVQIEPADTLDDIWPASAPLDDEPTVEQEHHGRCAADAERRAQRRFRAVLKLSHGRRPTFYDATPIEREDLLEEIELLKQWLAKVEAELKTSFDMAAE